MTSEAPAAGWAEWGAARRRAAARALLGARHLLRMSRHPGRLFVTVVGPDRTVVVYTPDESLLQSSVCRGGRPKVVFGGSTAAGVKLRVGSEYYGLDIRAAGPTSHYTDRRGRTVIVVDGPAIGPLLDATVTA